MGPWFVEFGVEGCENSSSGRGQFPAGAEGGADGQGRNAARLRQEGVKEEDAGAGLVKEAGVN